MSYILTTFFLWFFFGWLNRFRDWRKYYPSLIFSALLAVVADLLGFVLNQWAYHGPTVGGLSLWSVLGIAPAEGGLFIRLFPMRHHWLLKISYLFGWSLLNTSGEWFFVETGWIEYIQWNVLRALLFYFFFFGAIWVQEYWYNGTGRITGRIR